MRASVAERTIRGEDWTTKLAYTGTFGRLLAALLVLGTALSVVRTASANDALCRADPPVVATATTDATLTEAQALTSPLDRPRARSLYLAILARDRLDEEAAVGLAHVDASDGCFALAERGYRDVLARSHGNIEARSGLADILLWTGRWQEAQRLLDEGLTEAPLSPDLLSRRARVAYWSGDISTAKRYLAEAERVSPLDPEVREARQRVFVGEGRLGQRVQLFPKGYDNVYTTDVSAMQRFRRWRFEMGTTVSARVGATRDTRSGPLKTTVIDGRPSFGAFYHHGGGGWLGGTVGVSAPALALPRYALGLSAFTPLPHQFSLLLSAAYWQYRDERDVVVLSPALSRAITESIDVTVRYWLTTVLARHPASDDSIDFVHSVGVRAGWRPTPQLALGLDYTYGVQLERNPSAIDLLVLRSHIVSALARQMVTGALGFDGSVSVEHRTSLTGHHPDPRDDAGPLVVGWAAELGLFTRW